MDEFFIRATLVKERIDACMFEAQRAKEDNDVDRLLDLHREMDVLHRSMQDIRQEQLIAYLPKPKGRPWWKFWMHPEEPK